MIIDSEIEAVFKQGNYMTFSHSNDGSFKAWTNTELFIYQKLILISSMVDIIRMIFRF